MGAITNIGSVRVWFRFLQQAIRHRVPIDEKFYEQWGTKEQLRKLRFNTWWEARGRDLFANAVPKIELVATSREAVIVRIPTSIGSAELTKQVVALLNAQRGAKGLRRKPPLSFTGKIKLATLVQYQRYLAIDLDPLNAGKTIEQKTEQLRKVYRDIGVKLDNQKASMANKGVKYVKNRPLGKWLKYRDPDSFEMYKDENKKLRKLSEREIRKGINSKKISRWRLSGKLLLLNVAEGEFPGTGYYGAGLEKKLKARLKEFGLQDIGLIVRNKGGGQKKEDLTRVRIRRTEKERESQSLKLYGAAKNANPVGNYEKEQ